MNIFGLIADEYVFGQIEWSTYCPHGMEIHTANKRFHSYGE